MHFDPAQHQRPLSGKGMNVEPHARARRQAPREPLLSALEIGGKGQFVERRIAVNCSDLEADRTKHGGFVGRSGPRPPLISGFERIEAARLRSLDAGQARPVDRVAKCFADLCERVADR